MPKKKAASQPQTGLSKREFMDALPDGISIGDMMTRAKQSGVRISKSYAYQLLAARKKAASKRRAAKDRPQQATKQANGRSNGSPAGAGPSKPSRPLPAPAPAMVDRAPSGSEAQFLSLAVDLGLRRSQELLDRLRSNIRTLVG